ncbi:MAG: XRE family transcriptional regulator [Erysipelotrichia bacterium]|nr:XRE family transcriptional regulator [Erysipelotrichia bacterium]
MVENNNTFLEYLQGDKYYDIIYKAIFSWCCKNREVLLDRINGTDVSYISHIEEDELDLDFKNVWIDSKSDTRIDLDIAIDLSVCVEGVSGKHHDRDQYSSNLWVMIYCTGTMDKKLNDFRIIGVEEFNKSKPKKPLSGDFVPYIKKSDYEDYAYEILDRFYFKYHPEASTDPMAIDTDELAARMGLKVINSSIAEDRSIFGQVYFADTEVDLYDSTSGKTVKKFINKNTILVDEEAAYLRSFGSRNMTITHECVHSYFHRMAFQFAQMLNEDLHYIQCQVNGVMRTGRKNTVTEWMEIQANGLAPYILMPRSSVEPFVNSLFHQYDQQRISKVGYIENVIREVASNYGVTDYAARKRLIDLGFEEAIGALNWVDDHYVRPYFFKKGSLSSNETFTVNYKDIYKKAISGTIALDVLSNRFVYVDNHLCINDPKYIIKDLFGDLELTDYARLHMDECCVIFKYHTIHGFNEGSDFGLMCYLCRDCSKELEYDLEISSNPAKIVNDTNLEVRYRTHKENVEEVMTSIQNKSIKDILNFLLEYLDISIKEFEIDSGVNERTIRRYLNGENRVPNKKTVVAFLRTLNLPYKICEYALNQAGISFVSGNDEDDALISVLTGMRNASARQTNDFMFKLGFDPLTNED